MTGTGLSKLKLAIRRGATVRLPIRIETSDLSWADISAISQSAPAVITATAHGCPDGWLAAVVGVKGMTEINADPALKDRDFDRVTVIDANTVSFNRINSAGYKAYKGGGQLVFYTPLDLSAYATARMEVKDKVGGTQLLLLSTSDSSLEIDAASDTLWINMTATDSAALTFNEGVFDIELVTAGGTVKAVCRSDSVLTVAGEVTTSSG